jgi:hypothetical protein
LGKKLLSLSLFLAVLVVPGLLVAAAALLVVALVRLDETAGLLPGAAVIADPAHAIAIHPQEEARLRAIE